MSEVVLEGLGDEALGGAAEVELGLAEGGVVGDEGACEIEDLRAEEVVEISSALPGLGFLVRG